MFDFVSLYPLLLVSPPAQFCFFHSSFREKELKGKCKALLESKDEELKEIKVRYIRFFSTSDLPGHMHTAIRKPSSIHRSFSFHCGKEEVAKCISHYLNNNNNNNNNNNSLSTYIARVTYADAHTRITV